MFENVDGRTTDAGVTGILIAHLGAFGSGELINRKIPTFWRGERMGRPSFSPPHNVEVPINLLV